MSEFEIEKDLKKSHELTGNKETDKEIIKFFKKIEATLA